MNRYVVAATFATIFVVGISTAGCDKGPMQKAGEKVDEVTGQDKLIGKGPAEKTGREDRQHGERHQEVAISKVATELDQRR